ncbi:MAG: ABC transporter transmembrane domain-containing protein [Alphaproteobacteria bacterium]
MTHMLNANPLHVQKTGVGEHLHRMASIGKLKDFYNGYTLTTLAELAFVPLFLGLIFAIAGKLAFVPASILLVFALASILDGYKLRRVLKTRDEADDARFNFLVEALEGIHTIKAFALERFLNGAMKRWKSVLRWPAIKLRTIRRRPSIWGRSFRI